MKRTAGRFFFLAVLGIAQNAFCDDICDLPYKARGLSSPAGVEDAYAVLDKIGHTVPFETRTIRLWPSTNQLVKEKGGAAAELCGIASTDRWIFYDPSYIDEIYTRGGEVKWPRYFVFAHEAAHHVNGDTLIGKVWTKEEELAADYAASVWLKRLGVTKTELLTAFDAMGFPTKSVNGYPTQTERRERVIQGYEDSEPTQSASNSTEHRDIEKLRESRTSSVGSGQTPTGGLIYPTSTNAPFLYPGIYPGFGGGGLGGGFGGQGIASPGVGFGPPSPGYGFGLGGLMGFNPYGTPNSDSTSVLKKNTLSTLGNLASIGRLSDVQGPQMADGEYTSTRDIPSAKQCSISLHNETHWLQEPFKKTVLRCRFSEQDESVADLGTTIKTLFSAWTWSDTPDTVSGVGPRAGIIVTRSAAGQIDLFFYEL